MEDDINNTFLSVVQLCSLSHLSPHKEDTVDISMEKLALRRLSSKTELFPARIRTSTLQLTPINQFCIHKTDFFEFTVSAN